MNRIPPSSRSRVIVTLSAALLGALTLARLLGAQVTDARRAPTIVRVHVADSAGTPVADAEVTLLRGLKEAVATARTSAAGEHEFIVDLDSSDYSVVARKIGYARGDRFFAAERGTVDARVTMKRIEGTLPTVTVTAVDFKRKSYHVDADEIAGATTYIGDALDIVQRLRPDMILSRSGSWGGRTRFGCPSLSYIWVNGRRYLADYVIVSDAVRMRAKGAGNRLARMAPGNATILSEIQPEHVAEMNYRDCFEEAVDRKVGSVNALFITLKPGVDFRPGRPSYVVGDTVVVAAR